VNGRRGQGKTFQIGKGGKKVSLVGKTQWGWGGGVFVYPKKKKGGGGGVFLIGMLRPTVFTSRRRTPVGGIKEC